MINVIKDIDPINVTQEYDVLLVGTSIYSMLTNGFQSKIRYKYPKIDEMNCKTPYGDRRKLGKRLTLESKENGIPTISLLYICKFPNRKRVFIDYDALRNTLMTANAEFKGKKVMTTMLGASQFDGNGDKDKIMGIMNECLTDLDIDVYDYLQTEKDLEAMELVDSIRKLKDTDNDKYEKLWPMRFELLKNNYLPQKIQGNVAYKYKTDK